MTTAAPAAEVANITTKVEAAVTTAVAKPSTPADLSAIPAIMSELMPVVLAIANSSGDYPFYKSKVFWSAMLVLVGGVLALFKIPFSPDTQQLVLNIGIAASPLIGAAGVIYGRFFNKKPIGGTTPS